MVFWLQLSFFPAGSLQCIRNRFHTRTTRKPGKYERLADVTRTANVHQEPSWGRIRRHGIHALYGRKALHICGHIGPKTHEAPSGVCRKDAQVTRNRAPKNQHQADGFLGILVRLSWLSCWKMVNAYLRLSVTQDFICLHQVKAFSIRQFYWPYSGIKRTHGVKPNEYFKTSSGTSCEWRGMVRTLFTSPYFHSREQSIIISESVKNWSMKQNTVFS